MTKLLIVEDSAESFELIRRSLGSSVKIDWAKSIGEATRFLGEKRYDLVLLDITLPDGDGFHLCSMMQANQDLKDVAIIFLTARNTVPDKIMGFTLGADDFLTKPFDPLELKARVEAKLRRRMNEKVQAQILQVGDLEINRDTQIVSYPLDSGERVKLDLTPIEFKILLFLVSKVDHVHSRDDLLNGVWGENVYVYSRSVDTHVSKLRKKMGEKASYILSVHGSGYRFSLAGYNENRKAIHIGANLSDNLAGQFGGDEYGPETLPV